MKAALCRAFLLTMLAAEPGWLHAQVRTVEVIVVGPDGAVVPRLNVIVKETGRIQGDQMTSPNNDGRYYAHLTFREGGYTVVVCDGHGFSPRWVPLEWPDREKPPPTQRIRLDETTPAEVTGRVWDISPKKAAGGKGARGAQVSIAYEYLGCKSITFTTNPADNLGEYEIAGLPTDKDIKYTIVAVSPSRPGSQSDIVGFTLEAGVKKNVDLELKGGLPTTEASASSGLGTSPSVGSGSSGLYKTSVSPTIAIESTFARRIFATRRLQLNLEIPFVFRPAAKVTSDDQSVVRDYRVFFFTPSLRLTLAANRTFYPWFSLGTGLTRFFPSSLNQKLQPVLSPPEATSKVAFQAGAGVDIWPFRHFGFRTHLRSFYTGRPDLGVSGVNLRNNIFVASGFLIR